MSEELSGEQVIQRSMAAYDALSFYSGTSAVISTSKHGGSTSTSTAMACIEFARGVGLRFDESNTEGGRFVLVCGMERMWRSSDERGGDFVELPGLWLGGNPGFQKCAATTIPVMLLRSRWGYMLTSDNPEHARNDGREVLWGTECIRIKCEDAFGTSIFWVDAASFLLRQMRQEMDEMQSQALLSSVREKCRNRRLVQRVEENLAKSMMSLHVFAISSINEPLDEALFQKPD